MLQKGQAWYEQWFGADYLQLYQHRSQQEAARTIDWLVSELGLTAPATVLDLACGNGRHGHELVRRGFLACGLDLSWPLLFEVSPGRDSLRLQQIRGDMRHLPFGSGCFSLVLSLFTSFGYFSSNDDDLKVLQEVTRVMRSGGAYVLDFLNVSLVRRDIIPTEETIVKGRRVTILRWLDEPRKRVEKRILIHESEGAIREYRESVRLYTEGELREMFKDSDLSVLSTHGNYDGARFTSDSPRLILIGRKDG